jgi:hypothetical protein
LKILPKSHPQPFVTETPAAHPAEAGFERERARDLHLLRLFNLGTFSWSLLTVIVLLALVIPMRRNSPWLIMLSPYAMATRLGVFVARAALGVPRFVERVDHGDARVAAAARAVFERHRDAILPSLLGPRSQRVGPAPTYDEIGTMARARDIAGRRRAGLVLLAVWAAVTVGTIWILVATGGGPTG